MALGFAPRPLYTGAANLSCNALLPLHSGGQNSRCVPVCSEVLLSSSIHPCHPGLKMWTPARARMSFPRTVDLLLEHFVSQTLFLLQFRDIVQKE